MTDQELKIGVAALTEFLRQVHDSFGLPETLQVIAPALMNFAGAVPDDVWSAYEAVKFHPCDTAGCECHLDKERMRALLQNLRKTFREIEQREDMKSAGGLN